jgi:SAM-dependent methyltransferase
MPQYYESVPMSFAPRNAQSITNTTYGGHAELFAIEKHLKKYNDDLIAKLSKYISKDSYVLEFGAGIGTLAQLWHSTTGRRPDCLEIDITQREMIRGRGFACFASIDEIATRYDAIYTSNVLEHIEDDVTVLKSLSAILRDHGKLIIYVPASQLLYSSLDERIGHYRRYSLKELSNKLMAAGFVISDYCYSDSVGFFAWLYLKLKGKIPAVSDQERSMRIYDTYIFPVSKFFDAIGCKYFFGKNILVYAQKK